MPRREYIPAAVVRRVWAAAGSRCGYCLASQKYVHSPLEIEHIVPVARGGTDDEDNLWIACSICNGHKSNKTTGVDPVTRVALPLFNPRAERWADHFAWSADGSGSIWRMPNIGGGAMSVAGVWFFLPTHFDFRYAER